jgi:hypothetical protein
MKRVQSGIVRVGGWAGFAAGHLQTDGLYGVVSATWREALGGRSEPRTVPAGMIERVGCEWVHVRRGSVPGVGVVRVSGGTLGELLDREAERAVRVRAERGR